MDTTTLGRTGLKVSVMGVGGGGPSQLGRREGKPDAESIAIVRQALDAGVNIIDTSEGYGTEEIVGKAIDGIARDTVVISTKKRSKRPITPQDVHHSVETSLKRLGTDYIDIYSLHGVLPEDYEYLLSEIVPTDEHSELVLGDVSIRFIHTPGHTPGSQCFKLSDRLVSGDTLFIGACGRADLPGSNPEHLYESLTQKLMKLEEETLVFPGHNYAPPMKHSTIAMEKSHNPYFNFPSKTAFLGAMGISIGD